MSILALLALAQAAQGPLLDASQSSNPFPTERDERSRRASPEPAAPVAAPSAPKTAPSTAPYGGALPTGIATRLEACIAKADRAADEGMEDAARWASAGGDPYAAQCKGYALGRAGRWSEAAETFEAAAPLAGDDNAGAARFWSQAGNAALAAGDAKRALADLDAALQRPLAATPETGEIHLDRARARVANGDNEGARADLDNALRLTPGDPLAWLLSATLARRMKDMVTARDHIGQAIQRAPADADVALEEGIIAALSGDRDAQARDAFLRAQKLAPGSTVANSARAYLEQLGPDTTEP